MRQMSLASSGIFHALKHLRYSKSMVGKSLVSSWGTAWKLRLREAVMQAQIFSKRTMSGEAASNSSCSRGPMLSKTREGL